MSKLRNPDRPTWRSIARRLLQMQLARANPVANALGIEDCTWIEDVNGERGRTRTYNQVIKSHLLYQLSYAPC
jgi:hypothetical protein